MTTARASSTRSNQQCKARPSKDKADLKHNIQRDLSDFLGRSTKPELCGTTRSDSRKGSLSIKDKNGDLIESSEEREKIRDFWSHLTVSERRSLVNLEKQQIIRKMKEQQRHTCSCTVCGRRRCVDNRNPSPRFFTDIASSRMEIEEEIEFLFDAYYEELDDYAEHARLFFPNEKDLFSNSFGVRGL